MTRLPTSSVVVVSWNTRELLRACLRSVVDTTSALEVQLIVVDNGSRDGSPEMVASEFPQAELVCNRENLGFARANNQGMAGCRAEYALWLNSDAELQPEALARLLAWAQTEPRAGAVGAQLFYPDGRFQGSAAPFPSLWREWMTLSGIGRAWEGPWYPCHGPPSDDRPRAVDWVVGACMLVRTSAFSQIGGLDADYFMYAEEVDFCLRLRQRGWQVWYLPGALAMHHAGASSTRRVTTAESNLYRGRVRLFRKHRGIGQAAALSSLIYATTAVKRAVHGVARWASSGRRGREVVPLVDLHQSLREAWARPAKRAVPAPSPERVLVLTGRQVPPLAPGTLGPRRDYIELANRLRVALPSPSLPGRIAAEVDSRTRLDLSAVLTLRREFGTCSGVLSLSERVAIPAAAVLALLGRRVPHVLVAHKLSSGLKVRLREAFDWSLALTHVICLCEAQADYARSQMKVPADRVFCIHIGVDDRFFRPVESEDEEFLLAVGREQRDYASLRAALSGSGMRAVVVASGQWSGDLAGVPKTPEITVRSNLSPTALRDLYSRARCVVVPLREVDYAAGVNALLEAMAMGKPTVVTRTSGNADYLAGGGVSDVPAGDWPALRAAIEALWDDSQARGRLGAAARAAVESRFTLDRELDELEAVVRRAMEAE